MHFAGNFREQKVKKHLKLRRAYSYIIGDSAETHHSAETHLTD